MAASSRIFIKGLPPAISEPDFKKHFSEQAPVTDAKIFQNRRIGYVGYRTPEEAQKAVKYFNKTFIRMSRIGVELARPPDESKVPTARGRAPTSKKTASIDDQESSKQDALSATLKRKRDRGEEKALDPKLKEFLDLYKSKSQKSGWEEEVAPELGAAMEGLTDASAVPDGKSDDEYEQVSKKKAKQSKPVAEAQDLEMQNVVDTGLEASDQGDPREATEGRPAVSDSDWARSRTSRLLGLLDDEEAEGPPVAAPASREQSEIPENDSRQLAQSVNVKLPSEATSSTPTERAEAESVPVDQDIETVRSTMRLFIRNLPYDLQSEDLEAEFAQFGNIEEVHIPLDKMTGHTKGFAFIQFSNPDSAEKALVDQDGKTFQGRLLHILPASNRRDNKLDEFELAKLPMKKQQEIKRKREASTLTFNWNALYMNADAVVSSVASRLGLSKSEVLDPTSSDAAIKQAHAETHVIQETKSYFGRHGVDLDSFKKSQRGDTAILVKNIPSDCSRDELKRLFEEQGNVKRFLMPPAGTIAIVEFSNAAQCKAAFGALAYRRVKSSMLFLEKAPKNLFSEKVAAPGPDQIPEGVSKVSTTDLKDAGHAVPGSGATATLFVRNLNFTTNTKLLSETFQPLDGFMSARVKTRTDPKRPGEILSMGFGFLEFRTPKQAETALQAMDGFTLEGHKLQIRASHKGADTAEERKKADVLKKQAGRHTKIIIKNLPFEASKKDIRALFGAYGQLRSVRVPKKMDRGARGFAFADFTTVKEAQNAMDALRDTHLLGRRLVLDFAAEEAGDAEEEIERMQQKVDAQVNKVALQKLTSGGRKKFTTQGDEDGD